MPAFSAATDWQTWNGTGEAMTTASISAVEKVVEIGEGPRADLAGLLGDPRFVDVEEGGHARSASRLADPHEALAAPKTHHPEPDRHRPSPPATGQPAHPLARRYPIAIAASAARHWPAAVHDR